MFNLPEITLYPPKGWYSSNEEEPNRDENDPNDDENEEELGTAGPTETEEDN